MSKENLRDIEYKIDALRQNISSFASDQATFAGLQREIDLATQEYLDAQEKFNAAQNKSLVKESNIKQVLMAQPALEPESSKRLIIIAIAVVASFAFTLIVFIVLELMDLSIRTASIYKRNTKLKLIGVLNDLKVKNVNFEKIFSSEQNVEKTKKFKHLLRKIRFDINNSNSKIVLFTSTKNGEGKSFVLFSIAYSFSLMQKRVLIIDTNFRNNSLTNFLIPKSSTKYLLGAHENENWHGANGDNEPNLVSNNLQKNIIKRTSFKGIDVVGNNGLNLSPSEVFVNRDFKLLLKELATEYDFIFMEGSALNDFSDSKELIEYVDKVVAVFSARSTIKDIDKESIAYLSGINSKFLGGILNFVENKHLDI
ncbi:MAG: AAA family ATPase [Cyclobacteriaceae bacterium]|nr:AAA family ATPase [Cyclobacteriaceae bacterium]